MISTSKAILLLALAIAMPLLAASVAAAPARSGRASSHLEMSRRLLDADQIKGSLVEVNRALAADSKCADAYVHRAWLLMEMNRRPAALADLNRAIELNPKLYDAYIAKGYFERISKSPDSSRKILEKAESIDPSRPEAYLLHGTTCLVQGLTVRARKDFTAAIARSHGHPVAIYAYYWRGRTEDMMNKPESAIADFEKAIKLQEGPDKRVTAKRFGPFANFVYVANRKTRESRIGMLERALCYSKVGRYNDAIADFTAVIATDPGDSLLFSERGNAYLKLGKYKTALHDFNRGMLKGSPSADLYLRLAEAQYCLERYDRCLVDVDAWLKRTFWKDDQTVFAVTLKYMALERLGRRGEARALAADAVSRLKKDQSWPYPVMKMLEGSLSAERCLAEAARCGKRQASQARLYAALSNLCAGKTAKARELLTAAATDRDKTSEEYTIAKFELARLSRSK